MKIPLEMSGGQDSHSFSNQYSLVATREKLSIHRKKFRKNNAASINFNL